MVNQIVADSFETLGGGVKTVSGQVKQVVQKMGDDVAENIGLKPAGSSTGTGEQDGQQQNKPQDNQIRKMESKSKSLARKKYKEIQEEIRELQSKRKQETVKYREPGVADERKQTGQIKQLEEKSSFAKATADKKKLPPLPAKQASRRAEMFRGVSG